MYDNFKIANYNNSLVSPEFYARPLSRLFGGDVIDGLTVVPGTGLQVILQPGNTFLRYGSAAVASARIVSLVADFPLAIPTPDASNPRIDLVVVYGDLAVNLPVVDATHPPTSANLDGPGVGKVKIVSGTPAATPVAPTSVAIQSSVGASNPYTVVAQVLVDKAPLSVIAGSKITDLRKRAGVGSENIDLTTLAFGNYSASEVDTGFKWVNGKTIYKKTINFGALPNNNNKSVAHGIVGLDYIISCQGVATSGAGSTMLTLPDNVTSDNIRIIPNQGVSIVIYTISNRSNYSAYITLFYTKV